MREIKTHQAAVDYLVHEGWQPFVYHSSYYGSKEGADWEAEYLFHPEVDISGWKEMSFGHGSYRYNDEDASESLQFGVWVAKLPPERFLATESFDLDDYGCWPEEVYGLLGEHRPSRD